MKLPIIDPSDPLLRSVKDIPPGPLGLTPYDMLERTPRPGISRTYTVTSWYGGTDRHRVEDGHLLAHGAAVMQGPDGLVRHVSSVRKGRFVGFVERMLSDGQAGIRTQGIVVLSIPEVGFRDKGKVVYATEPNSFNLSAGIPIGRVVHCGEAGSADVMFAVGGVIEEQHWESAVSAYAH